MDALPYTFETQAIFMLCFPDSYDSDQYVYFAGEIYDTYQQMGVPGAILSGYYAVDKLLTE